MQQAGAHEAQGTPGQLGAAGASQLDWRLGQVPQCSAAQLPPWHGGSPQRTDIHQAQLAPLMSALLGVAAPTNGRFVLPEHLLAEQRTDTGFSAKVCCTTESHAPMSLCRLCCP